MNVDEKKEEEVLRHLQGIMSLPVPLTLSRLRVLIAVTWESRGFIKWIECKEFVYVLFCNYCNFKA